MNVQIAAQLLFNHPNSEATCEFIQERNHENVHSTCNAAFAALSGLRNDIIRSKNNNCCKLYIFDVKTHCLGKSLHQRMVILTSNGRDAIYNRMAVPQGKRHVHFFPVYETTFEFIQENSRLNGHSAVQPLFNLPFSENTRAFKQKKKRTNVHSAMQHFLNLPLYVSTF